jgi:NAD(P)-dependent dehydrogenase (short-subunit alcohol dehydrogenase family)
MSASPGPALVTGGARRLGAAIARALAAHGHPVVIHCHHSRADAEALAAEIRASGGAAAIVAGDLAALSGLAALHAEAARAFGPPRLLVNNASIFLADTIADVTPEGFETNLAVNLAAPVLLAQAFAQTLPEGEDGAIVNVIDQRVLRPDPRFLSYTLAKSALFTATKTLAQALAPRIRVNAVGPGPTLPSIHEGEAGLMREARGTLLGDVVDPAEIARAVLYLAAARHVTGQMIAVDSGQHLGWRTPDTGET